MEARRGRFPQPCLGDGSGRPLAGLIRRQETGQTFDARATHGPGEAPAQAQLPGSGTNDG